MSLPEPLEIPPSHVSNAQLFLMLQQMSTKQSLQMLRQEEQQHQLDGIKSDIKNIVAAWNSLGWISNFIKYAAAILGATVFLYYSFTKMAKDGIHWLLS